MHGYYQICTQKIMTVVFLPFLLIPFQRYFFPANITTKTILLFIGCNFSQFEIIKFSIMYSSTSQSLSRFLLFFKNENKCAEK